MQPPVFASGAAVLGVAPGSIHITVSLRVFTALLGLLSLHPAWGQSAPDSKTGSTVQTETGQPPVPLPAVNVTGYADPVRKTDLSMDPAASPASITVLKLPPEKTRNTRDYTELLKPITGVVANNFDQGGVGFGFTLRGFSERSNGGSAAITIDGVPVNLPSNVLTNGYADLTPFIPELVDRFELMRGPFDVRFGSNALGGSLRISMQNTPPSGAVLSGGTYEFGRGVGAYTFEQGAATGFISLLASTTAGYRDNADLKQVNTFNKVLFPMAGGVGSVRMQVFSDDYGAPGFLRRSLVENGTLNPRTAINPTDGGNADLQILSFNYRQNGAQPITANAYVFHSDMDRYSTRVATVPVNPALPGQALQSDKRIVAGGTVEKYSLWDLPYGMGADLLVGVGVRADFVESAVFNTNARVPTAQTEGTDFTLTNPYGYVLANLRPLPWLKLTGGFRYDQLIYDIEDRLRLRDVSPSIGVTQPKAGIVISPLPGLDFFANYGQGFLAPSAIGGQLSLNPDLDASKLTTREVGVQFYTADGVWRFLANAYRTTFTNEILNQPPPLMPVALGPSRRDGFDVEARVRAYNAGGRILWVFANYSKVDGELENRVGGTSIPDVAEFLVKYGFDLVLPVPGPGSPHVVTLSAAQFWEGPKPLNTTNTLNTKTFSRIDGKLTYTNRQWKGFSAFVGINGYPDRLLEETAFTFGTPVQVGVSPKARVTAQAGIFVPF